MTAYPHMPKNAQEEAFDRTFEEAIAASRDPENHTLLVHKWEDDYNAAYSKAECAIKEREVTNVLDVMGGNEQRLYCDPLYTREQFGDREHGLIGLACTGISEHSKFILYGEQRTGLLLQDAPPVAVSCSDSYSEYFPEQNPCITVSISKTANNQNADIVSLQGDVMEAQCFKHGGAEMVNPKDPKTIENAREAYDIMMSGYKRLSHKQDTPSILNEVNANVKPEHIAGVLVDMKDEVIDRSKSWSELMEGSEYLRCALLDAKTQLPWIREAMQEKGIMREPTIVLYQANAKTPEDRFVHFPPTKRNLELVDGAFKASKPHQETLAMSAKVPSL